MVELRKQGITQVHYIPVLLHPYYRKNSNKNFPILLKYYKDSFKYTNFYSLNKTRICFYKLVGYKMNIVYGTANFKKNYGLNK